MTFGVAWAKQARNDLAGLPPLVAQRVLAKVEAACEDPIRWFTKLKGRPGWRVRVGDYRVVADLNLRERTITVIAIGHRRNVYDR